MNFGVVVVLYKPTDEVIEKVSNYTSFGVEIAIIDNTPLSDENRKNHFKNKKLSYLENHNQGGIARAFNIGLDLLSQKGCDYLFTFDQDSNIPENFFTLMESFIARHNADFVCPDFFDVNSNTRATFITLTKWNYKKVEHLDISTKPLETSTAISSGMGFSKNVWLNLRYFNEGMIIDHVDTDFCIKAISKGYKIKVNFDVCLPHAIGERQVKKLFGVTFKPNNHNYIRKYYIVRNGTYLGFKYFFKYPSYFYLNILRIIHETVCVIFYEKDKLRKLRYMLLGLFHSIIGKIKELKIN